MTVENRRTYGEHLTSENIFIKHILPDIRQEIYNHTWVDLFAGEGSLILPILSKVPKKDRIDFFREQIFLFDIQEDMVIRAVNNAVRYGIPENIARQNIKVLDTIKHYPDFIRKANNVFHITNPPYLYIGYIVKNKSLIRLQKYFSGRFKGYQDLYQLAMMNDLINEISRMIYIIPSNFLFSDASSNKIRDDFLYNYNIEKTITFEKKIFKHTGTHVSICFFKRKEYPDSEKQTFAGTRINKAVGEKTYTLNPSRHYRASSSFEEFLDKAFPDKKSKRNRIKAHFYLTHKTVSDEKGENPVDVIDSNDFHGREYKSTRIFVNDALMQQIKSNILWVRTIDSGSIDGKAGLYIIRESFNVDGIYVSKERYRTHPIQVFLEPELSFDDQLLLKKYFNLVLEHFRNLENSDFLTTYKYSNSSYVRKYLGLNLAKDIICTFPIYRKGTQSWDKFKSMVESSDGNALVKWLID